MEEQENNGLEEGTGEDVEAEAEPKVAAAEAPPTAPTDWESVAKERYDQLVRLQADFENYRRRLERDREEFAVQLTGSMLGNFLPVYDNLERAVKFMPVDGEGKSWRVGVEMTLKGFDEALAKMGVEPIATVGEGFDPKYHEAIGREPNEQAEGTIIEELLKGFRWRDRVLRAALVKVSAGSEHPSSATTDPTA